MFNFKWFKWPQDKISDEEFEYLERVCDVQREDAIPESVHKIVKTLKRLRSEE